MDSSKQLLSIIELLCVLSSVSSNSYSVKLTTEQHVNEVDTRFLSFTIDPKYLFSSSEKYNSKECVCMASSLMPAYIRIAGPSTAHMTFKNTTITIADNPRDVETEKSELAVGYRQWGKFVQWAKSTGFDLVFALNNEEKMSSGMWDPNTALNILTVAEKANVGDIFWQLGYECSNQSIEEYLNDLETLQVITETFPPGRAGEWKVVGGDVTNCLHGDSKSDFKDYIVLSNDMMDAVMLNGNSSSQELERMSDTDRLKLLKLLSHSTTPLWLTETTQRRYNELQRAADWLSSLGYSARNGFSVHYRELVEDEMYEPSLSFYMALLFKNLVGERVLNLEMEPDEAILFAHCTSLRHKAVPGAVTLYGVNMDDEPARFSVKLSKREEGGDIMQFILGHDHSGNIVVNGRAMFYEGDIKPIVKRVRPYKTLLINLPPKSFGFWVLANTNVKACQNIIENDDMNQFIEAVPISEEQNSKRKRSITFKDKSIGIVDFDIENNDIWKINDEALNGRIYTLHNDLAKPDKTNSNGSFETKVKRHIGDNEQKGKVKRKLKRLKPKTEILTNLESKSKGFFGSILNRRNNTRNKHERDKRYRSAKNNVNKRNSKNFKINNSEVSKENMPNQISKRMSKDIRDKTEEKFQSTISAKEKVSRRRRSLTHPKHDKDLEEILTDNDIDGDNKDNTKLWTILSILHKQLQDLSVEKDDYTDEKEPNDQGDHIVVNTELLDDGANINVSDASDNGFIKSTIHNLMTILADLNKNLNRFWSAITLLE